MPETIRAEWPTPNATAAHSEGKSKIRGLAIPWNTPSRDMGGWQEMILPDAIQAESLIGKPFLWRHEEPIGWIVRAWTEPDGVHIEAELSDPKNGLGRAALALAGKGPLGLSAGYNVDDPPGPLPRDGIARRAAITVEEISGTHTPAFVTARVTHTLEAGKAATMPDTDTIEQTDQTDVDTTPAAPPVTVAAEASGPRVMAEDRLAAALQGQINDLAARISRLAGGATYMRAESPLGKFASLGEFTRAAYEKPELMMAWTDQTTTDNPGLMQPSWLTDVKGIIEQGRPFITATGGPASAGETGLEINWPYYAGDLAALFVKQAVEKTEIGSAKVQILKGTAGLDTLAFGSDISLQLIERSTPAYLDAYMRIMYAGYAMASDVASIVAAEAVGTGSVTYNPATPGSVYQAAVASAHKVWRATGQPPSIITIRDDSWDSVAGAVKADGEPLYPAYNPTNTAGKMTLPGGLAIEIAGLPAIPVLGQTVPIIVTNGLATRWHEDGPKQLTNDVAMKLGRDVAVYGYGGQAGYIPAGVVKVTQGVAQAARSGKQ